MGVPPAWALEAPKAALPLSRPASNLPNLALLFFPVISWLRIWFWAFFLLAYYFSRHPKAAMFSREIPGVGGADGPGFSGRVLRLLLRFLINK